MDSAALSKQMKTLKSKSKAARKGGKGDNAKAFRAGAKRLARKLRAAAIAAKSSGKKEQEAASAAPASA